MKKFVIGLLMFMVFAVTVPLSVDAQCRRGKRYNRSNASRTSARTNRRYSNRRYATRGYTATRRPSFYRRHRNLINVGIGAGGGALIGALAGGKKGALIGTAVGAGGGALYTYVLNKKKRRY